MVNISPSTLSVIAAALSGERAFSNVTHSRIEEALQSLLPGNTSPGSVDLQPGEEYLVWSEEDQDLNTYSKFETLKAHIEGATECYNEGRAYDRDAGDMFRAYIIRRTLSLDTERTTKVTIS